MVLVTNHRNKVDEDMLILFIPSGSLISSDNLLTVHGGGVMGRPLSGLRILDVGCGGGLLTEVPRLIFTTHTNCSFLTTLRYSYSL